MSAPEGIPADYLEHYRMGRGASERSEWQCGPFRLRRVAMVNGEPWLADLGRGATACAATPTEAMARALQVLRDEIDERVNLQSSAEDALEMIQGDQA
jgi:hypothetical protein